MAGRPDTPAVQRAPQTKSGESIKDIKEIFSVANICSSNYIFSPELPQSSATHVKVLKPQLSELGPQMVPDLISSKTFV